MSQQINGNDPAFPSYDWNEREDGKLYYNLLPGASLRTEIAKS